MCILYSVDSVLDPAAAAAEQCQHVLHGQLCISRSLLDEKRLLSVAAASNWLQMLMSQTMSCLACKASLEGEQWSNGRHLFEACLSPAVL